MYLNENKLCGWVMSQYLSYSGFKWLNWGKINRFDVNSIAENSPIGYTLEVDLEYPDGIHELHNNNPLAPEKLKISHNMLSNYCSCIANKYDIKLVPNLGNKSKYVLHYRNLQLYLSMEMKLVSTLVKNILIQTKEKMLPIVLKKNFSN